MSKKFILGEPLEDRDHLAEWRASNLIWPSMPRPEVVVSVVVNITVLKTLEALHTPDYYPQGRYDPEAGERMGVLVGRECFDPINGRWNITIEDALAQELDASSPTAAMADTSRVLSLVHEARRRHGPTIRMVGWYHTHPGMPLFLSEPDQSMHAELCDRPWQVAMVFDPKNWRGAFFSREIADVDGLERMGAHQASWREFTFPIRERGADSDRELTVERNESVVGTDQFEGDSMTGKVEKTSPDDTEGERPDKEPRPPCPERSEDERQRVSAVSFMLWIATIGTIIAGIIATLGDLRPHAFQTDSFEGLVPIRASAVSLPGVFDQSKIEPDRERIVREIKRGWKKKSADFLGEDDVEVRVRGNDIRIVIARSSSNHDEIFISGSLILENDERHERPGVHCSGLRVAFDNVSVSKSGSPVEPSSIVAIGCSVVAPRTPKVESINFRRSDDDQYEMEIYLLAPISECVSRSQSIYFYEKIDGTKRRMSRSACYGPTSKRGHLLVTIKLTSSEGLRLKSRRSKLVIYDERRGKPVLVWAHPPTEAPVALEGGARSEDPPPEVWSPDIDAGDSEGEGAEESPPAEEVPPPTPPASSDLAEDREVEEETRRVPILPELRPKDDLTSDEAR